MLAPRQAPWLEWPEVRQLAEAFAARGVALRFVGGCVRDSLLGRMVNDVDAATPALPEQVMHLLSDAGIRALPTGLAHGTVTAVVNGRPIEITTLRRDAACDGRHAEVQFTDDWAADAARRDFTINAVYADAQGRLFDDVGGLADLSPLRLRFIGNAGQRVEEDALRILRFFRFSAQLAIWPPDEAALTACTRYASAIARLSGERIAQEMLKLLSVGRVNEELPQAMFRAGITSFLLLEEPPATLARHEQADALAKLALWLLASRQPADTLTRLAERWKLSVRQREELAALMSLCLSLLERPSLPEQKKLLRAYGRPIFLQALGMARAQADGEYEDYALAVKQLAERWEIPVFPLSGQDLLENGYAQGAALGQALKFLEAQWEAADYALTRETLLAQARQGGST